MRSDLAAADFLAQRAHALTLRAMPCSSDQVGAALADLLARKANHP